MKKKSVVTAVVILFICVAVYVNWNTTNIKSDEERVEAKFGESSLVVNDDKTVPKQDAESENEEKESGENSELNTSGYFSEARMEKQKARDSAITTLKETLNEETLSQDARDEAALSIETISTSALSETRIETLVKAKGYKDCVALINDEGVNVIVPASREGLEASDITKIKDIAVNETKFSPSSIKIIEIK